MWPFLMNFYLLISVSCAFYIDIEPNNEECFFDRVERGQKLTLHYEVAEGGFLDIDTQIFGPDGEKIYSEIKKSNGRPSFIVQKEGIVKYCFGNKMSSLTPKVVLFELEVEEDHLKAKAEDDEQYKKLVDMFNELSHSIESVKLEMEYVTVRTNIHWDINQNTNFRVVVWAAFEALLIVAMSIGQVFYLKRFFEVRRLV
ncbi:Transmembrane emp24 domain trafficking protein 2 [Fasciolopsis buskii]|uniref:Transmembrane emp24 domain trafficking protein 2 n=1 Tax=Fasciolopsis buskii TaxID=27845 RepID=A0A8E0RV95_9TREM|nr:Transmembrane emp24 domain trafficking protein 2 [Fasciolopsis buski]